MTHQGQVVGHLSGSMFSAEALVLWSATHIWYYNPFRQGPVPSLGGMGHARGRPSHSALLGLPGSPQQERTTTAIPQGRQEEPIIFLFPSQPIPWGFGGAGREAGERPPEAAFQRNYPCTG